MLCIMLYTDRIINGCLARIFQRVQGWKVDISARITGRNRPVAGILPGMARFYIPKGSAFDIRHRAVRRGYEPISGLQWSGSSLMHTLMLDSKAP